MGASRLRWMSAIVAVACLATAAGPWPATAQVHEDALRSLDWAADPLARSPRLLGMGRLTLADDLHNRLSLWEFAGNPTGLAEAESLTTFEYRPIVRNSSIVHDASVGSSRERQELSARQVRHLIETWRRQPGRPAYGIVAELATLETDRAFAAGVERRGRIKVPAIGGAMNARVPWLKSDRFDFAMRLDYRLEFLDDDYFEFLRLPQGDYLGQESAIVPPPDLFSPDRVETSGLRGGAAVSMRVTRAIKAAIGYDRAKVKVRSSQIGLRSTSKIDEDRPYDIGQASLAGRLGPNLEWVADGRAWRASSEEFFLWTISAGQTQVPLSGSGKRLDRDERGTSLRTRVRWMSGPLEVGAALGTSFRREIVTPWFPRNSGDPAGFNDFLGEVGTRVSADTLTLPQRVVFTQVEDRSYEFAGGVSWHLAGGRGMVGAEAHRRKGSVSLSVVPNGPEPSGWDVRAGGEYRLNAAFTGRAGWGFGIDDRDDLAADDSRRTAIATAGFGHQPVGSRWSMDVGYAHAWGRSDYVDPLHTRDSHHHLALQMRWQF